MTASFGQPTADENLTPGWNVQGNGSAGSPGPDAPGYGQAGNTTLNLNIGQAGSGSPLPAGAMNVGSEASAAYAQPVLANPGYADATGPATRALPATIGGQSLSLPTVPATGVVVANPSNLAATVTISANGATITSVHVGGAGQTYAQAAVAGTAAGTYTVPPNGVIGIAYTVATPTWTWAV